MITVIMFHQAYTITFEIVSCHWIDGLIDIGFATQDIGKIDKD